MAVDKELEIKLQFLDEASEYLQALDGALLDVAQKGVLQDDLNAALRSAHSIKGGAAMMGYTLLSDFAHRLEDSLKVLKVNRNGLVVDDNLERLLLSAVAILGRVIEFDRSQTEPDEAWLADTAMPVFDQLYDLLGEADPDDANVLLSSDENQDIIPVLFSTEVEGCLGRLEAAIADNTPQLREEVSILAQELGGLGEMLQLSSFCSLCTSVEQAISAADGIQVMEVAQAALSEWRNSQSLILIGQMEQLPTALSALSFEVPVNTSPLERQSDLLSDNALGMDELLPAEPLPEDDWAAILAQAENAPADQDIFGQTSTEQDIFAQASRGEGTDVDTDINVEPAADSIPSNAEPAAETLPFVDATQAVRPMVESEQLKDQENASQTEFRFSSKPRVEAKAASDADQDATVRVSVRQLNELNDYFGDLTIERHRLDSEVKRLRSLVKLLHERLRSLEESEEDLRDAYDQTAIATQLMLPAANGSEMASTPDSTLALHRTFGSNISGFDALEMDRYDVRHLPFRDMMETAVRLREVADDIEISVDTAEQSSRNLQRTTRQLQRLLVQLNYHHHLLAILFL